MRSDLLNGPKPILPSSLPVGTVFTYWCAARARRVQERAAGHTTGVWSGKVDGLVSETSGGLLDSWASGLGIEIVSRPSQDTTQPTQQAGDATMESKIKRNAEGYVLPSSLPVGAGVFFWVYANGSFSRVEGEITANSYAGARTNQGHELLDDMAEPLNIGVDSPVLMKAVLNAADTVKLPLPPPPSQTPPPAKAVVREEASDVDDLRSKLAQERARADRLCKEAAENEHLLLTLQGELSVKRNELVAAVRAIKRPAPKPHEAKRRDGLWADLQIED